MNKARFSLNDVISLTTKGMPFPHQRLRFWIIFHIPSPLQHWASAFPPCNMFFFPKQTKKKQCDSQFINSSLSHHQLLFDSQKEISTAWHSASAGLHINQPCAPGVMVGVDWSACVNDAQQIS
ncbi:hypothetical protein XENOCAPTIV_010624 [Xenoophorus captivus]|uniref:Uncharacterized protein n=1 Tax=Xenoophorus captivus TaxID=1517983 RepID=A0ABV0Q4R9_9TELE